jgi:hypothetical protein
MRLSDVQHAACHRGERFATTCGGDTLTVAEAEVLCRSAAARFLHIDSP